MKILTLMALNVRQDHFVRIYVKATKMIKLATLLFTAALTRYSSNCFAQDITVAIDSSTCPPMATFTNHTRDLLRVNWDFTVVIDGQQQIPWNIFIEVGPHATNQSAIVVSRCENGHAWRIPSERSRLRWNR